MKRAQLPQFAFRRLTAGVRVGFELTPLYARKTQVQWEIELEGKG
jgi:hypothetical protein